MSDKHADVPPLNEGRIAEGSPRPSSHDLGVVPVDPVVPVAPVVEPVPSEIPEITQPRIPDPPRLPSFSVGTNIVPQMQRTETRDATPPPVTPAVVERMVESAVGRVAPSAVGQVAPSAVGQVAPSGTVTPSSGQPLSPRMGESLSPFIGQTLSPLRGQSMIPEQFRRSVDESVQDMVKPTDDRPVIDRVIDAAERGNFAGLTSDDADEFLKEMRGREEPLSYREQRLLDSLRRSDAMGLYSSPEFEIVKEGLESVGKPVALPMADIDLPEAITRVMDAVDKRDFSDLTKGDQEAYISAMDERGEPLSKEEEELLEKLLAAEEAGYVLYPEYELIKDKLQDVDAKEWNDAKDAEKTEVRLMDQAAFGGGGGTWTGVVWFGNDRTVVASPENLCRWADTEPPPPAAYIGVVSEEYLVVDLRDGSYRFEGNDDGTPPDVDDATEQIFHVAEYVEATDEREAGYRLIANTQGDIHARIT